MVVTPDLKCSHSGPQGHRDLHGIIVRHRYLQKNRRTVYIKVLGSLLACALGICRICIRIIERSITQFPTMSVHIAL